MTLQFFQVTGEQMGLVSATEIIETRDDPQGSILIVEDREQTIARDD